MRFSSALLVASAVVATTATALSSGQLASLNALGKIMGRQTRICKPVSVKSCSLSCGEGFVTCVSWPTCYNPSRGDSCCSDGTYCKTGYYCTNAGCCPNGTPLDQCGATSTLSVILPPAPEETGSSTPVASSSSTTTTTSRATTTTTTSHSTTSSKSSTSYSSYSYANATSSSTTSSRSSTTSRAASSTTSSAPLVTFSAAAHSLNVGAAQAFLGGLAMFMMW